MRRPAQRALDRAEATAKRRRRRSDILALTLLCLRQRKELMQMQTRRQTVDISDESLFSLRSLTTQERAEITWFKQGELGKECSPEEEEIQLSKEDLRFLLR